MLLPIYLTSKGRTFELRQVMLEVDDAIVMEENIFNWEEYLVGFV